MPTIPVSIQSPIASNPLNANFGHAPLGTFAGRSVAVGLPGAPRAGNQAQTGQITPPPSLGSRLLNALTPSSVRVDSKVRQHLFDYSAQLSKTMGTVASTDVSSPKSLQKLQLSLSDLGKAAQPLGTQGVTHNAAFQAQVELRLGQMSQSELTSLRMGLADASLAGVNPATPEGRILASLTQKASAAQGTRFEAINARLAGGVQQQLAPIVEQLKQLASQGKVSEKFIETHQTLSDAIGQLAEEFGPAKSSSKAFKAFQTSLLKEALQSGVGDSDSPADMGQLMNLWPADSIKKLVSAEPVFSRPDDMFDIERLVTGQIGVRAERFETALLEFGKALLAHDPGDAASAPSGPRRNPEGFAKEIVGFQKNLADLVRHNTTFDLTTGSKIDETFAAVRSHLQVLLSPSNLNLGELSTRQFGALRESLQKLDIQEANSALSAESGSRRATAQTDYGQALTEVAVAVQGNDLPAMLTALQQINVRGNQALLAFQATGDDFDGADPLMQLRADLMDDAIAKLSLTDARSAFDALDSVDLRKLTDGMQDIANAALRANEPQGKLFFNASTDLQLLRESFKLDLTNRGVALQAAPAAKPYDVHALSGSQKLGLEQHYGFKIDPGGVRYVSGLAPAAVQKALVDSVAIGASIAAQPYQDTGVAGAFYRDLGRADYTITQPGGTIVNLVDRTNFNIISSQDQDVRRKGGADQLIQLLDNDPALLLFVTNNIHQGLLANLQFVIFSNQSPIELEDGTRGQLSGDETIGYNFSRNDDGAIDVQVSYSIKNATALLDPSTGRAIATDPANSNASFSFTATITPDRTIAISKPAQFEFNVSTNP